MTDILRIKRRALGGASGPPPSLAVGELAYNEQDGTLYIGRSNGSIVSVGGAAGGGNVSNSGTPTNGQIAQWTDATHIQGIAASWLPLAGGTLTGVLTLAADPAVNLGAATKQYADSKVAKGGDTMSGLLTLSGNPTTLLHAATKSYADMTASGVPQGRLTLQGSTPVMIINVGTSTTMIYTPYVGQLVPISDGTNMVMTPFSEITCLNTDTTKNPSPIGASKVNDWFVWNDAGTMRLSHGPDWTNDTTRSAGTALFRTAGILVNSVAITNGPAAFRGTYVGTTHSNASGLFEWWIGAAGPAAAVLGVWNCYNRRLFASIVTDTSASWVYTAATLRPTNGSIGNRISFVTGLMEDSFLVTLNAAVANSVAQGTNIGIGFDSTTTSIANVAVQSMAQGTYQTVNFRTVINGSGALGYHFVQGLEAGGGAGTVTWSGGVTLHLQGYF